MSDSKANQCSVCLVANQIAVVCLVANQITVVDVLWQSKSQ